MKDGSTIGPDSRLYLGNLHPSITDGDLKLLLSQFGPIDYVNLHRDELGNSKGFAFTRYARAEDAANAMLRLQVKTFLSELFILQFHICAYTQILVNVQ